MAETVFQGIAGLMLDGKGRMTVPTRHREVLSAVCGDRLTFTKSLKRCLTLFPRPAWESFREKLLALPLAHDDWRDVFLGSAMDVDIDSASRVLVPPELREWAGIERDVVLLGIGSRFHLWDKLRYEAHEATLLAGRLPDVLANTVL